MCGEIGSRPTKGRCFGEGALSNRYPLTGETEPSRRMAGSGGEYDSMPVCRHMKKTAAPSGACRRKTRDPLPLKTALGNLLPRFLTEKACDNLSGGHAVIAQLVEQPPCKRQVVGSSPIGSSTDG